MPEKKIDILEGKTFSHVRANEGGNVLWLENKEEAFILFHNPECCDNVCIESIQGDLDNMARVPIWKIKQIEREGQDEEARKVSFVFTTAKGTTTINWTQEIPHPGKWQIQLQQIRGYREWE